MSNIKELLRLHNEYHNGILNFIPSENTGIISREMDKHDIDNRYYFGKLNGVDIFPGQKYITPIYHYVEEKLKKLLRIEYLNLSPISGLSQMQLILLSICKPGDLIMTISPAEGGHYVTKRLIELFGFKNSYIPFEGKQINFFHLDEILSNHQVKMVYIDQMTSICPIEIPSFIREKHPDIFFYNDVSHNLAFVISKNHKNPLGCGFDAFGGSFHKTFPGSHKAFVASKDYKVMQRIGQVSSILFSSIHIGDLVEVGNVLDFMDGSWERYTDNILRMGKIFADILVDNGFDVLKADANNVTYNHQLLFNLPDLGIDLNLYVERLKNTGIMVNNIFLPFNNSMAGIRMGFQEVALLGMREEEIVEIAHIFVELLSGNADIDRNRKKIQEIKQRLINDFNQESF